MKTLYLLLSLSIIFTFQSTAQTPGEVGPLTSIDSYTTFQGDDESQAYLGEGEYQIFYDNVDGVFDKPMVLVDGYDPNDTNDIDAIYGFLVYNNPPQNYLDELRDTGIDIVILNFPTYVRTSDGATINGGGDYIQRNGLILVNLLETINNDLVGDEELIIVGPSMGGLISRYALTYMEQNTLDHNSGLWISFDSPHLGANVPISFQYAINYLAEQSGDADMIAMRDIQLNSPASKQLLLDHYTTHLQSGDPFLQDLTKQLPIPNDFRNTFMSTMNSLGFPQQTRNLSIINGSLNGSMVESPGALIFDTSLDLGSGLGADIALHFTPAEAISNYEVDYIQPTYVGFPVGDAFYAYAESPAYTAGLDSAPGGTVLFDSFLGANPSPVIQQIIAALQMDAFSFIPTLSSCAIDEQNWYNSVDGTETIPYDDYIGGTDNEPHLTLNQEYVDFLINEIETFYLSTPNYSQIDNIRLLGNPVQETIRLLFNTNEEKDVLFKIYTTTGQLIASYQKQAQNGVLSLPSPDENGIYYLSIFDGNKNIVKKIIVKK